MSEGARQATPQRGVSAPPTSSTARRAPSSDTSTLFTHRTSCRACTSTDLVEFLDLGETPPANEFVPLGEEERAEHFFPLVAYRCRACGLVQLLDAVAPEYLFSSYRYFSSASGPVVEHFRDVAAELTARYIESADDLVVEIGSNDGVFLQNLVGKARVVGVDPAANIAQVAEAKGITVVTSFFGRDVARAVRERHGPAKLIFAANVLAHIDDLDSVMDGVDALLTDDGVLVFEVHRFADMLSSYSFDQIYHEHVCYWSLEPIERMLARFGLRVVAAHTVPMQGESFQIHAVRVDDPRPADSSVERLRRAEIELGLGEDATYVELAAKVSRFRVDLTELLRELSAGGNRIAGYGATAKGNTLLNFCGLGTDTIESIADSTPAKQGTYTPGTRIPVIAPEMLRSDPPDYILLLAWNYADYILLQERELRERGVKFIVPFPELRVIDPPGAREAGER